MQASRLYIVERSEVVVAWHTMDTSDAELIQASEEILSEINLVSHNGWAVT